MIRTFPDYKVVDIVWLTDVGVEIYIHDTWDWIVFCDIFINHEYDFSVTSHGNDTLKVLDLGANIGYFSLFTLQVSRKAGVTPEIIAVEGNPNTFSRLAHDVSEYKEIKPLLGLVGKKTGAGYMGLSDNHATSALVIAGSCLPHANVDYIDLDTLFPNSFIDILKIDVEGSEYDFVDNYADLLRRTKLVFMELHSKPEDDGSGLYVNIGEPKELIEKMKSYGFKRRMVMNRAAATTEVFYREKD